MAKLGVHIIRPTAAAMKLAAHMPVVKAIDSTAPLQAAQPGAIKVYRLYLTDAEQNDYLYGVDGGVRLANRVMYALNGYRDANLYVELLNEKGQRLHNGLIEHVRMMKEAVPILHTAGLKVAGFSFSTGNPEREDWEYLRIHQFCGVDAIAIHTYWGNYGLTVYNALRYRMVHTWLNGVHPPFVITECGRDAVEGGRAGYKLDGITDDVYLHELSLYAHALNDDEYVLGATIYTAGATPDWAYFDIDDLDLSQFYGLPPITYVEQEDNLTHTGYEGQPWFDLWLSEAGGADAVIKAASERHGMAVGVLPTDKEKLSKLLSDLAATANQAYLIHGSV